MGTWFAVGICSDKVSTTRSPTNTQKKGHGVSLKDGGLERLRYNFLGLPIGGAPDADSTVVRLRSQKAANRVPRQALDQASMAVKADKRGLGAQVPDDDRVVDAGGGKALRVGTPG